MAKTHPSYTVNTTFTGINITSAASVYTFTAAASARVSITVKLTNAAGNGDYIVYLTHDWLGAAAASTVLPKTTAAAASGETNIEFMSIALDVANTDVVNVMVDGLAGDNSVNGAIRIVADNPSVFEATDTVTAVTTVTTLTGHTAQTGDTYAVVTNATYGLEKLARTGADSDTLETLSDQIDGIAVSGASAQEVWEYSSRTLTQSAAQVTAAVAGGTVTILRGDTLTASFTGLGDISGRSKLWWSVKDSYSDPDTSAILQIEETAGLLRINGGTAGTTLGSVTVTNANTGALTIFVDETITDDLTPRNGLYYDVQMLTTAGAVQTLTTGAANITPDVTRAVA